MTLTRYRKRTLPCNPRACKGSIKLLIILIWLLEMWLGLLTFYFRSPKGSQKNVLWQQPWKVSHQWEWQLLDTETESFLTCYFIFRRMIKWLNWCTSMVLKGGPSLLNTWKEGLVNSVEKGICNASVYSMIIAIRVYYKNELVRTPSLNWSKCEIFCDFSFGAGE